MNPHRLVPLALACLLGCISEGGRRADDVRVDGTTPPEDVVPDTDLTDSDGGDGGDGGDSGDSGDSGDIDAPDPEVTPETDTEPPDTTIVGDGGGDGFDAETADVPSDTDTMGIDTRVGEIIGTCTSSSDCVGVLPDCSQWTCPAGTCEAAPRDGACDDGDACTGTGTCQGGQCFAGPRLTCGGATACGRPACDPTIGCFIEAIAGGLCDATGGTPWGRCDGNGMAPIDTCTATGVCVDEPIQNGAPLPSDLVLGTWFVLSHSSLPNNAGTFAGLATFDAGGKWGGTFAGKGGGFTLDDTIGARAWCLDSNHGLALDLAINHFTGQVDLDADHFALSGRIGSDVMIGIRPTGTLAELDGTYQVLHVSPADTGVARLSTGTFVFSHGCLEDEGVLGGDSFDFFAAGGCFSSLAPSRVQGTFAVEPDTGSETTWKLVGALGVRSEVFVAYREDAQGNVAPGLFVGVRLNPDADLAFRDTTQWISAFTEHRALGTATFNGFPGAWHFEDRRLLNGTFGGAIVFGDEIAFDDYGRFLVSLRSSDDLRTFSGYLAASGAFGFFYPVTPPESWVTVLEVSETPTASAWGLIVNRP